MDISHPIGLGLLTCRASTVSYAVALTEPGLAFCFNRQNARPDPHLFALATYESFCDRTCGRTRMGEQLREKNLFSNTKAGKNLSQQIIGGKFSRYFTERLMSKAKIFSEQLASAMRY